MIKHTQSNLLLMKEITSFLKSRNNNYNLWYWAISVPLTERLDQLFGRHNFLVDGLEKNKKIITDGTVLDLGCGFCPYWPFLSKLGYNRFLGYDLYSKRGYGSQEYMKTAKLLVEEFCEDCEFMIVEDDVRNIAFFDPGKTSFLSSSEPNFVKEKNFDLIYTKNTDYKKVGSTGMPVKIFEDVCKDYLKQDGTRIYAG